MNDTLSFADWLQHNTAMVEKRLTVLLSRLQVSPPLAEAMRYSTLDGGKRLRPAVLFAVADDTPAALDAACAVEFIHCYSLIHDDMPCMDDDDVRRDKPSCHKAYGEAMALLAGDCLQSLAFETLAATMLPPQAVGLLAAAAGAGGMGGGQALDIVAAAENEQQLATMHRFKTGALFECALKLGLLCRRDGDEAALQQAIDTFAREFGLLFQISNDLQDIEQDKNAGKPTYATLLSPKLATQRAADAKSRALAAIDKFFPRLADITHAVYS